MSVENRLWINRCLLVFSYNGRNRRNLILWCAWHDTDDGIDAITKYIIYPYKSLIPSVVDSPPSPYTEDNRIVL